MKPKTYSYQTFTCTQFDLRQAITTLNQFCEQHHARVKFSYPVPASALMVFITETEVETDANTH